MRISDWSSDVCSSDLRPRRDPRFDRKDEVMKFIACAAMAAALLATPANARCFDVTGRVMVERAVTDRAGESHLVLEETADAAPGEALVFQFDYRNARSEEHTSELQSLMRISYAVFCLKKKTMNNQ